MDSMLKLQSVSCKLSSTGRSICQAVTDPANQNDVNSSKQNFNKSQKNNIVTKQPRSKPKSSRGKKIKKINKKVEIAAKKNAKIDQFFKKVPKTKQTTLDYFFKNSKTNKKSQNQIKLEAKAKQKTEIHARLSVFYHAKTSTPQSIFKRSVYAFSQIQHITNMENKGALFSLQQKHSKTGERALLSCPFSEIPKQDVSVIITQIQSKENYNQTEPAQFSPELAKSFVLIRKLGRGSYSTVYAVIDKFTNTKIALKLFEKNQKIIQNQLELFKNEISVLKQLSHPKIVKLIRPIEDANHFGLMLELVDSITLGCFLKRIKVNHEFKKYAFDIFKQIVDVVCFCHSKNIFHRDIKTSNILVKKDLSIVLIDFGFAVSHSTDTAMQGVCGTLNYMAPEILNGGMYKAGPVDVWALGVLLFFVLTHNYPFKG